MMRRPKIPSRMKFKPMVHDFVGDVAKEILVGRDGEGRRTVPPFDPESTVGFNLGKIGDRPCVRDDMAVAHDAAPAAAGRRKKEASQESVRYPIHNSTLADEMTSAPALDSYFLNLQLVG